MCHHPAADYTNGHESFNYLGTPGLGDAAHTGAPPHRINDDATGSGLGRLYSRFGPAHRDEQKCGVGQVINMDGHELFSQLCTSLTLIKIVQYDHVYVQKKRTLRLWRDWLAQCAFNSINLTRDSASVERSRTTSQEPSHFSSEFDRTIWTDQSQNVGLKVWVCVGKSSLEGHGRLQSADEDQPVSYDLNVEGM